VRNFLIQNGYTPQMNSTFKTVLQHMHYAPNKTGRSTPELAEEAKLVALIQQYTNGQ
jgi:hypothetical protein